MVEKAWQQGLETAVPIAFWGKGRKGEVEGMEKEGGGEREGEERRRGREERRREREGRERGERGEEERGERGERRGKKEKAVRWDPLCSPKRFTRHILLWPQILGPACLGSLDIDIILTT